jgi:hypothetical protein
MGHSTLTALIAGFGGFWLGFATGQLAPDAPGWALAAGGLFGALLVLACAWRAGPGTRLP